jgi:serine/threonine-protein kinase
MQEARSPSQVGRYALSHAIAAGGMGTLHLGRLVGPVGFARTVAIKRLHRRLCADPSFVAMFADEARLAARVRHPNVVPTLDVVQSDGELLIVMEYVDGESLSSLVRQSQERVPLPIAVAIVSEMLHGLHSAHEAKSEDGEPLELVHRDVSPQNVLVGSDGVTRLVDFGIARATACQAHTGESDLRGKLAYMAPEQLRRERVTRQTDIFAAGIVLWELLTGTRLFAAESPGGTMEKILVGWVAPPSSIARELPPKLDEITLRALDPEPKSRYATARDMAVALEDAVGRALARDVAAWVESTAASTLAKRRALVALAERGVGTSRPAETAMIEASLTAPMTTAVHRPVAEPEPTTMAFAASESSLAPTVRLDIQAWPEGGRRRRTSLLLFAVSIAATVALGASWSRGVSTTTSASPPSTEEIEPPPEPRTVAPPSEAVADAPAAFSPALSDESTRAGPSVASRAAAASIPSAPVRRTSKPRVVRARPPCVAKLDPTTLKRIYEGDCD